MARVSMLKAENELPDLRRQGLEERAGADVSVCCASTAALADRVVELMPLETFQTVQPVAGSTKPVT